MADPACWDLYLSEWAHNAERAGLKPAQVLMLLAMKTASWAVRAEAKWTLEHVE